MKIPKPSAEIGSFLGPSVDKELPKTSLNLHCDGSEMSAQQKEEEPLRPVRCLVRWTGGMCVSLPSIEACFFPLCGSVDTLLSPLELER